MPPLRRGKAEIGGIPRVYGARSAMSLASKVIAGGRPIINSRNAMALQSSRDFLIPRHLVYKSWQRDTVALSSVQRGTWDLGTVGHCLDSLLDVSRRHQAAGLPAAQLKTSLTVETAFSGTTRRRGDKDARESWDQQRNFDLVQ
jgi:hypothetical protein